MRPITDEDWAIAEACSCDCHHDDDADDMGHFGCCDGYCDMCGGAPLYVGPDPYADDEDEDEGDDP
ncbi:hypothetical protein [Gordonia sp. SND2]|uniref:hypothetical protein n=1 Tax=Gordonia sp. SND2 TaxID=3388659 RepID=UPI00398ADC78